MAVDVGGTKTRLVFVDSDQQHSILYEARYLSGEFDGFEPMRQTFIQDCEIAGIMIDAVGVDALSLALPGLVSEDSAGLTNLPWIIEKHKLKDTALLFKPYGGLFITGGVAAKH